MACRLFPLLPLILLLFLSAGCQQRASNTLVGRWVGQPDTAEMRNTRESEKYGDEKPSVGALATNLEDGDDASAETVQVTDWESYEAKIVFEFESDEQVKMTLNGEQPIAGTWKVISTNPTGCMIEVETEAELETEPEPSLVRRRFDLLFDQREGTTVGFQLSEAGADPQLGALYFKRD